MQKIFVKGTENDWIILMKLKTTAHGFFLQENQNELVEQEGRGGVREIS